MICSGKDATVEFDSTIQSVSRGGGDPGDLHIAPGFIDLQVNGFAGVDFNDPNTPMEAIGRALDAILATGVTRCLPTVITGSPDAMLASLGNLYRAKTSLPRGRAIAGFHVEGPYIDPADGPRGAHPARWVRPPDPGEFARWQEATQGNIRLVTLSPHWPEAPALHRRIGENRSHREHRTHRRESGTDRGRGGCRRHALHAPGKRGPQIAAEIPQLSPGSTRGRSSQRELHRRRNPSRQCVPAGRAACKRHCAGDSGYRRRGARGSRTWPLSARRARCRTHAGQSRSPRGHDKARRLRPADESGDLQI